jgi:CO/xanthine dehydrogenase Mo-binding subunit
VKAPSFAYAKPRTLGARVTAMPFTPERILQALRKVP